MTIFADYENVICLLGEWYNDYCGNHRRWGCKRESGASTPRYTPITPHVIGFCPKRFFGVGKYYLQ